jgi:hypothetical protein
MQRKRSFRKLKLHWTLDILDCLKLHWRHILVRIAVLSEPNRYQQPSESVSDFSKCNFIPFPKHGFDWFILK